MTLRIDADRMRADFEQLATIGATADGGVERTTFSDAHLAARAWFLDRGRAAGLEARIDSAANHSLRLPTVEPDARTLLLGSHLDSVRRGGRYDGALGVVAALEVLRSVADLGLELPVALEAIDFTDEEGTLIGTLGSMALTGELSAAALASPRGGRETLVAELARMELTEESMLDAGRDPAGIAGYLELHIEQGPVLERAGIDVGIVTGIVGAASFHVHFSGAARHAGTTPMDARRDAALGAAAFVLGVRETVVESFPGCVATAGGIEIEPGAFNVVPGRATVLLECRSLDAGELVDLEQALIRRAQSDAGSFGLDVEVRPADRSAPARTHEAARAALEGAARELGLSTVELPSGAGHDAQTLARVTRSGMVFIPSAGGVSHDPSEHSSWPDCVNGANVLLGAAVALARSS